MHYLRSLNVGKRLAAGFGLLLILMVLILVAVIKIDRMKSEDFDEVVNGRMNTVVQLERLLNLGAKIDDLRRIMLIRRGEHFAEDAAAVVEMDLEYNRQWQEVITGFEQPDVRALADAMTKTSDAIPPLSHQFSKLLKEGRFDEGRVLLMGELQDVTDEWEKATLALIRHQQAQAREKQAQFHALDHASHTGIVVLGGICLLIGSILAWLLTRSLTAPLAQAVEIADGIAGGKLDHVMDTSKRDELGNLIKAMQRMQDNLRERIERDHAIADENLRIRSALDNSSVPTFVTDAEDKVMYANAAFTSLMQKYQANIRKCRADFDANNMIGKPVSQFGISEGTLRRVNHELETTGHSRLQEAYGEAIFVQHISVIRGQDGQRLGDVCQWSERTLDVMIEAEVTEIIHAATRGDLSRRVSIEGKTGTYLKRAQQLNRLLDATQAIAGRISHMLSALSAGDLSARIEGDFEGAYAKIRDDANATAAQLSEMVARIQDASKVIETGAREIASGNHDLSRRTEQQAANLEETAASMEELTTTVRNNAEHAREANQLTLNAADVAKQGGDVVGQVVNTMSEIEASSKKIADIITVIDSIAFQTNILALNAAVEAARAGEQGRGFAVVATEVRSLAQRSATAAREIKDLIENSTGKVSQGAQLAAQAGKTMGEIVTSVHQVTDIMAEISAASQEQAAGIEQINQTIMQMDETTQKNAALVEEAAASAGSMEQQANALAETVAMFRLAS